ncbi:MAG: hypothetical protein LQ342_005828 [Letrouitia transgressa]|nr:MAG: hypothetical protein LQ342_005828 [Letrouitia transgressa]
MSTERVCPGYLHNFDLVLRDQTAYVRSKAQRKRRRGPTHANTTTNPNATAASPQVAAPASYQQPADGARTGSNSSFATNSSSGNTATALIPRSFNDSPESQAVCSFFTNYVLIPRHPYSRRGYLECLLPLYTTAREDSLLSLATSAMALAIHGGAPSRRHCRALSRSSFGKALVMTSKAIRDPVESIKDETLMAVLLLSFYERVLATAEDAPISGVHDTGAVALVKHRGKENGKSELSARLLLAVQTQVVEHCIDTSTPFQKTSAEIDSLRPQLFENAASRLTSLSAKMTDFKAFANSILQNPNQFPTKEQLFSILEYASDVEAQVSAWPDNVPPESRWTPSHSFDDLPSYERKKFVYGHRVDIYHDIWLASIWNSYRASHIMIQDVVLQTLTYLNPPPTSHRSHSTTVTAIFKIQQMADDICASVPFNLGTKTFGGAYDHPETRYPTADGVIRPSSDYRKAASGLGGYFLMEPLKTASKATCLREGQQEWILKTIERVQRIYNIGKSIERKTSETPSPKYPNNR